MSKKKAVIVTAILTAMTVAILLCLLALKYKIAFFLISAVFAFVGLAHAALAFFDWITEEKEEPEEDLDVPSVVADPETQEQVASTVDEIMAEVKG